MQNKIYTVTQIGSGTFGVFDQQTGATVNRFNIPGQIVSGPIVQGDTCSITTRSSNTNTTYVLRLPSGTIINRFVTQ